MKCSLCNSESKSHDSPATSRNTTVECPECGKYEYTSMAWRFYLGTGRDGPLEQNDGLKLSEYVKEKFNPEAGNPVLITKDVVKAVTGKESVHVSYE